MADERCVYENVLRDASSLCVDIFRKLPAILMETSDQPNLPGERIFRKIVQLFRWIALNGELHVRHAIHLVHDTADAIKSRACEHGARYKGLVDYDDFWDEKRLRTLKNARRTTRHHHVAVDIIAPLLDWVTIWAKKKVKEAVE